MIRHNVLFNIKTGATESEIELAFNQLAHLKNLLPGFLRTSYGECTFHNAANIIKNRVYGFSIDFADENAYNEFLNNPITNSAKSSILNITVGDMNGIYGFDIGRTISPAYNPSPLDKRRVPVPRLVPRGYLR